MGVNKSARSAHRIISGSGRPRVCAKCGTPLARVLMKIGHTADGPIWEQRKAMGENPAGNRKLHASSYLGEMPAPHLPSPITRTLGWRPTCSCGADWLPGIVLDPFAGSGTTLKVAQDLGRRWVGIEICEQYLELIRQRLGQVTELPEGEGAEMVLPLE